MYRLLSPIWLFVGLCWLLAVPEAHASRVVSGTETWQGKVTLEESVLVAGDGFLTILPGTELRFAKDASLAVNGRLVARGSAKRPIVFRPLDGSVPGSWQGLSFQNAKEDGELEHVRIEGATQGLSVVGCRVRIEASTLQDCDKGIVLAAEANALVKEVTLRRMGAGAIDASVHALGTISDCRIEKVEGFGIQTAKQATLAIRTNHISGAKYGILMNGQFPPLEGNVIKDCEVGIGLIQAGPNSSVRGNRISGCKIGIGCRQFCAPVIEGNVVEGCEEGIQCYQSSSPTIRRNRLARNRQGLSCIQMCNPLVVRNDIVDNRTGVYLQLSSYARIHENNFERNDLHLELDNMSYDWELRASHKPKRSRQAQNAALVEQGRARPESITVKVDSDGFVDATGNYWGATTTAEMAAKGGKANIAGISDGYDVPTLTYEGWQGEYKKDRVHYDDWKPQRIAAAGPAAGQ